MNIRHTLQNSQDDKTSYQIMILHWITTANYYNFILQEQKLKLILFVTLFNLKDSKPSLKFAKLNLGKALFRAISKTLVIHP